MGTLFRKGINLIQEGNNVLKTKRNSELGGTYVDSAMYNSWLAKALAFLKLFLEDVNEFVKGLQKSHRSYYSMMAYEGI